MGWLWGSSPSSKDTADARDATTSAEAKRDFSLSEEQRARIFGGFGSQNGGSSNSSRASSRQVREDEEIEAFLKEFVKAEQPSAKPAPASAPKTVATTSLEPAAQPAEHDRILPDGTLNIHPDALYPATMSCRQAFDQAFYCQSLGGKFNDIYRFGHLQSCSEQWGAFWFCMRTRTLPEKDRQQQVREYYRDRDDRRVKERGGSSEDIWELRTTAITKAFHLDPDAEEGGNVKVKD